MASFDDLNNILNSEAGEIARKLDANDGDYDGNVDLNIFNRFLQENGFKTYSAPEGTDSVPFIVVAKMIYNLKKEQRASGDSKIKIDFDPAEEMLKAKKSLRSW